MIKKYEILNIFKDALLDLPDISDKPNEDGTYSVFDKKVDKNDNGDLVFTFTEEHGSVKEQDTYIISAKLEQEIPNLRISDVIKKLRNITYIMIHDGRGGSMSMYVIEMDERIGNMEFEWFEFTTLLGSPCVEFTLYNKEVNNYE